MSNRQARREQARSLRTQRASGAGQRSARRPPGRPPRGGSWLTQPFTLIVAAVLVVLVVILAVVVATAGNDDEGTTLAALLEEAHANLPSELADGYKLGADDAPVKLTMFEDFQCPYCLRFTANQEPVLVEEFVKTGKVQIIYEHYPGLGRESVWAANASYCAADQNKFWDYQNLLFLVQARAGQAEVERNNVGRYDPAKLKEFGRQVGVPDTAKFDACVDGDQHASVVNGQYSRAKSMGITGTPGFLLNGLPLTTGALADMDGWRKVLNDAVAAATASPTASPAAGASPTP